MKNLSDVFGSLVILVFSLTLSFSYIFGLYYYAKNDDFVMFILSIVIPPIGLVMGVIHTVRFIF